MYFPQGSGAGFVVSRTRVVETSTVRRIAEVLKEVFHAWEQLNKNKLPWLWKPDDVMNDGYASFYKLLFNAFPSAKRVSIDGVCDELISEWLIFVRGVVD